MRINNQNYEIWFIDYLDGKLNHQQLDELKIFLMLNPELEQELDEMEQTILQPEKVVFANKNSLKKTASSLTINDTNFDDYAVALMEGDLSSTDADEFKQYLNKNKNRATEYERLRKTKLVADLSLIYPNKNTLKKSVYIMPVTRKIVLRVASIAALLLLFVGLYIIYNPKKSTQTALIKSNIKTKPIIANVKADTVDRTQNKITKPVSKKHVKNIVRQVAELNVQPVDARQHEQIQLVEPRNVLVSATMEKKISTPQSALVIPQVEEQPDYASAETYQTINQTFKQRVNKKVFDKIQPRQKNKIDFWDVALFVVKGINKVTGSNIKLNNKYDAKGQLKVFELSGNAFAISKQINKNK